MSAPAYRQIADYVTRQIASGALIEGERLPPERAMAAAHGVAVGTLRKALDTLEDSGLVERRHGSGNYVRGVRDAGGLYGFFRLERVGGGGRPDTVLVDVITGEAPPAAPFARAHRIRRIRTLDGAPVAVEEIWLDAARAPGLTAEGIGPSLYATYFSAFGLRIARIEDRCGAAPVPEWGAGPLDLAAETVIGHVSRRSEAQDGVVAEVSETWFDPARARHVTRAR